MLKRRSLLLTLVSLTSVMITGAADPGRSHPETIVRVTSGTPGHEVRFRGVLLIVGRPMRVVEQATPFEFHSDRELVLGAFEPAERGATLQLELSSGEMEPAAVTAPRVIVGQRLGGVATEFLQGY